MKRIKEILKIIAIILIIAYIFLLSAAGVFLCEPHGKPAEIEWELSK